MAQKEVKFLKLITSIFAYKLLTVFDGTHTSNRLLDVLQY